MSDTEIKKIADFKSLLRLLELERRTYIKAGVPEETQKAFGVLLKHLNRFSPSDILALYAPSKNVGLRSSAINIPSPETISSMSLEQIEEIIADEASPRRLLEAIAVIRFHFPHGSLRSLANMQLLKDKIGTRIRNERAHATISSAAQRAR